MIITGLLVLHFQEDSMKSAILDGLDTQAIIAARGIDSFIQDGLSDTRAVASALPLGDLMHGRTSLVENYLQKMLEDFPKFSNGIFILDKDGSFMDDYPPHPELDGTSFAFREYYQRTVLEGKGIAGAPYKSKRTGLPVLTFTSPVFNKRGRLVAIVACSADLLSQNALGGYREQKFGKTGYLYIFDRSRRLIVHPEDGRLLTYVAEGKNRELEDALKGFEGVGETVNSKGIPMLLAVRMIPHADWIVAVQIPQKEAYATIAKVRNQIIAVAGGSLLLLITACTLLMSKVSVPLRKLEMFTAKISAELEEAEAKKKYNVAEESLDILRDIRFSDEIGMLASAFSHLAGRLRQTLGSLQRSAADWERTFNSVNEAVMSLDNKGRIVRMNRTAEDWFRTSAEKVKGQYGPDIIFGADKTPGEWPDISSLLARQKVAWLKELERPRGVFEFTFSPISDSGETAGAVLIISNVTQKVESEEQIREMAFYDQLTGLPNRFLLQDRIQLALATAGRNEKKVGIMFLDLDEFKEVNDRFGHDAGDAVLKEIAGGLLQCLRKNDTAARLAGDEFVVVLQDIEAPGEAEAIAERIVGMLALPVNIKGQDLTISLSIGIAIYPDDGEDGDTLLKNADTAMYEAKRQARNNFRFYDP